MNTKRIGIILDELNEEEYLSFVKEEIDTYYEEHCGLHTEDKWELDPQ